MPTANRAGVVRMKRDFHKNDFQKPAKNDRPRIPALEWLENISERCPRIAATGNRRVLVENHTGVRNYREDAVEISTRHGMMTVCGEALSLCEMRPGSLIVSGRIFRIDFPHGGDET